MINKARGRRPGNPNTRARILEAAHARLLTHGYAGTTLRAVAADVGVDVDVNVALISYYFGSKQGLFSAVMTLAVSPPTVLAAALQEDPAHLPDRLLAAVLTVWDEPSTGAPLRALVTLALAEPAALQAVIEFLEREVIIRLAEWLGGPQAHARAAAAITTIAGVVFTRYVLRLQPIAGMPREQLVHHLSPAVRANLATTRHHRPGSLRKHEPRPLRQHHPHPLSAIGQQQPPVPHGDRLPAQVVPQEEGLPRHRSRCRAGLSGRRHSNTPRAALHGLPGSARSPTLADVMSDGRCSPASPVRSPA